MQSVLFHLFQKKSGLTLNHNEKFQNTQYIQDMKGVPILKCSIRTEYRRGIGRPASECFHHVWQLVTGLLIQTSIETQNKCGYG